MQLQFFTLSPAQAKKFAELKTTEDLAMHGPLALGQTVPVHTHTKAALYVVEGSAAFTDGQNEQMLGQNSLYNAVLVPEQYPHGWKSLFSGTLIEHTFSSQINQVLAAT